jgi:GNAT superfamily N-acetyltransferase
LIDYIQEQETTAEQQVLRAWSVKTPSDRFGDMHDLLRKKWTLVEEFQGAKHSFGSYFVFSVGLNKHPVTPCPLNSIMLSGSALPLAETEIMLELKAAEGRYTANRKATLAKQQLMISQKKSAILASRMVDLTEDIAKQIHNDLTDSFSSLMAKLFPIAEEYEPVFGDNGMQLFVQADKYQKYPPNERRILALLNEDRQKVVGAIAYGVTVLPEDLRTRHNIDAAVGITYLLTDTEHRGESLGKQLINMAIEKAKAFIQGQLGIKDAKIMTMTEQNDPMTLTLINSIKDFSATLIGPMQRLKFWGGTGVNQRRVQDFPYIQVSLRDGLEPCNNLGLYIALPGKEKDPNARISSDLLGYVVKSYADLNLNKQQRCIDDDSSWQAMQANLSQRQEYSLEPCLTKFAALENKIRAAIMQESVGGMAKPLGQIPRDDMTVKALVCEYESIITSHAIAKSC